MKITKEHLALIIREEASNFLNEILDASKEKDDRPANIGQINVLTYAIKDLMNSRDQIKKRISDLENHIIGKLETMPELKPILPPKESENTKTINYRKIAELSNRFTKQQLEQIVEEETFNVLSEITPKTKFQPGGFKGILKMATMAEHAVDNLETKFADKPPQEIYDIQKQLDSIKKEVLWQIGSGEALYAFTSPETEKETERQAKRMRAPAFKRDTE